MPKEYKIYQFERNIVDPERKVSAKRGSLVKTNDVPWISKFGIVATLMRNSSDDFEGLVVEVEDEVKADVPEKLAAKPKVSKTVPKKKNIGLGKTTAVLGKDVKTKDAP